MTLKTAVHCILSQPHALLATIHRDAGRGDTILDVFHVKIIATMPGFGLDDHTLEQVAFMMRNVA